MRDIKFRIWDEDSKIMYYDVGINQKERLPYRYDYSTKEKDWKKLPYKFYEREYLMQYTELKDKNGVEIYEGDIIKAATLGWDEPIESIYEVVFEQGMFGIIAKKLTTTSQMLKLTAFETEIIGNIYENSELLEEH